MNKTHFLLKICHTFIISENSIRFFKTYIAERKNNRKIFWDVKFWSLFMPISYLSADDFYWSNICTECVFVNISFFYHSFFTNSSTPLVSSEKVQYIISLIHLFLNCHPAFEMLPALFTSIYLINQCEIYFLSNRKLAGVFFFLFF